MPVRNIVGCAISRLGLVQTVDTIRDGNDTLINHYVMQFVVQAPDFAIGAIEPGLQLGFIVQEARNVICPVTRWFRQFGQYRQFLFQFSKTGEQWEPVKQALDLIHAGLAPGPKFHGLVISVFCHIAGLNQLRISGGLGVELFFLGLKFVQLCFQTAKLCIAATCLVETIYLFVQSGKRTAEGRQTRTCRKQQLTDIAFARQDAFTPGLQRVIIE